MKKDFSKQLKFGFQKNLGDLLQLYTEKSIYIFPGEIVFILPTNDANLAGYFVITPDHNGRNRFTVDVGWSTLGRFPQLPRRPFGSATNKKTEFGQDEFSCRLSTIWGDADFWWQEGASVENGVGGDAAELAAHAASRILTYGIDYLDSFISSRGKNRIEPS